MSEDNQNGGEPLTSISKNSSVDKRVRAGFIPARSTLAFQPFLEGLHCLGLELTAQQSKQFLQYQQELLDWNTRVNLTSITSPEEVMIKHFLDSLSLLMAFDAPEARLLDIGAGAGFPGLPLKIVRPQWQLTLLEATGKKAAFLQHLIETLDFTSIAAVHGRAEELAHKGDYRATFDVVTARAVASLPALLEYASPFCRVGGQIILPKKGDLAAELANGVRAARKVGAVLKDDIVVRLPGLNDGRRLLVWEQVRTCPAQFPRSGSVMAKKPLG
ncbi:MAG: 16S rRNA (guanine(527)-N(7))-methyltransferase RsmG [Ktedonobacteraceae bacterium]